MYSVIKQCFSVNIHMMQFLHLYPPEKSTSLYKVMVFIMFLLLIIPPVIFGMLFLLLEEDINMATVADNAFAVAAMTCYIGKYMPFITNGDQIKRCIHYFESPFFNVCNDKQQKIIDESVRICRRNNRAFFILVLGGFVIFAIKPFLLGHYKLPFDVWLPFDPVHDLKIYISVYVYLIVAFGYPSLANVAIEPLIGGLACLATAHLQVLKDNLQHLDEYTKEDVTTKNKSVIMYNKIKQCVKYHDAVISFVREFEESFSPVIFSQLVGAIFIICFCCLQMSMLSPHSLGFFQMICYVCLLLTQIYFYCYYGTTMSEESNSLTNAIYSGNWYDYDLKSRKALIILMERSKIPMVVSAGKVLGLSLDTFVMILRRSYSLLAVLKNY